MKLRLLAVFLLLFGAAGAAQAAIMTISDTASFSTYTNQDVYTSGSSRYTGASTTYDYFTLDRFNGSLGTLLGVSVRFTSTWNHRVWANSDDDSGWGYEDDVYVRARGVAQYGVYMYDPYSTARSTTDSEIVRCSDDDGYCSDYDNSGNRSFNRSMNLSGFSLADFIGNDSLNLYAWNSQDADILSCDNGGNDDCSAYSRGNFWGQATVTYRYQTVPEPGTLSLFGLALLAFGISRKLRKA